MAPTSVQLPRTGVYNRALRVTATSGGEIVVVGIHKYRQSCGASLVFPVSSLGRIRLCNLLVVVMLIGYNCRCLSDYCIFGKCPSGAWYTIVLNFTNFPCVFTR